MNVELKEVHVGQEINKRLQELKMKKTEFGRLIGVPQQHINRILERDTMETKKLVNVCRVLDINIFAKFCSFPTSINAYLAAVSMSGAATNLVGDNAIVAQMEIYKKTVEMLQVQNKLLEEQVSQLKSNLVDKDQIISLYKTQLKNK
jgi:hypothetical protein